MTIIAEDTAVSKSIGVYLQSVLNEIGYEAEVKPISPNIQFTYIQNTNNKVQMSITAVVPGLSRRVELPERPVRLLAASPKAPTRSINIAGFCDKDIDAKMKEAFALGVTDPAAANKIWADIDKMVTDNAPAAPLFTPKHIDFVSKRLGNFQFNAQFYWMVTQSWVQ